MPSSTKEDPRKFNLMMIVMNDASNVRCIQYNMWHKLTLLNALERPEC